jgi:hypothetical protein
VKVHYPSAHNGVGNPAGRSQSNLNAVADAPAETLPSTLRSAHPQPTYDHGNKGCLFAYQWRNPEKRNKRSRVMLCKCICSYRPRVLSPHLGSSSSIALASRGTSAGPITTSTSVAPARSSAMRLACMMHVNGNVWCNMGTHIGPAVRKPHNSEEWDPQEVVNDGQPRNVHPCMHGERDKDA